MAGITRKRLHSVTFATPQQLLVGVTQLRKSGFVVGEVFSPFPVHGLDEALDLPPTRLAWGTLAAGILGLFIALGFQLWVHTTNWPLNIGGKSFIAWPGLIPVTFEVVVLLSAFATVGGLFWRCRLAPPSPTQSQSIARTKAATDNKFIALVEETDGSFSMQNFQHVCQNAGAEGVETAWEIQ